MSMKRASQQSVEVYDPSFTSVLTIPRDLIVHLPPSNLNISRLVLCRNHAETGHCPKGHSCKFVHADASSKAVTSTMIHVNYAWRSADKCEYKRLPVGHTLKVLAPNNRAPAELIPSERVLVTRGAVTALQSAAPVQLSHCAHFHFNRICNRGDKCSFIHAVYVDPAAEHLQKAPAPSMTRHQQFPLAEDEEPEVVRSEDVASEDSVGHVNAADETPAVNPDTVIVYQYRHDPYSFHACHVTLISTA